MLWDGTYGFSSLSERTGKSNRLQMSLQRQFFLLSYFKDPECWSSRGLNSQHAPAQQTGALPTGLIRRRLTHSSWFRQNQKKYHVTKLFFFGGGVQLGISFFKIFFFLLAFDNKYVLCLYEIAMVIRQKKILWVFVVRIYPNVKCHISAHVCDIETKFSAFNSPWYKIRKILRVKIYVWNMSAIWTSNFDILKSKYMPVWLAWYFILSGHVW